MKRYCVVAVSPIVWGVALVFSLPAWAQGDANTVIQQTGAIFTYVIDTGNHSKEPLAADLVASKPGWQVVPEDAVDYAFTGDAVLINDKLVAVVRGKGVDVYTLNDDGATLRGSIAPAIDGGKSADNPTAVKLVENTPGAGELEVAYGGASLGYRLTTGQIQLEMTPKSGVESILVDVPSQYLVAPDFFADDLVYTAAMFDFDRVGLPAENFYLHLAGDGDLIVTCVWKTPLRQTHMRTSGDGGNRAIVGSEITCEDGDTVWVAFAEHEGMWHTRAIAPDELGKEIALTWSPPFSAKWRGDFVMESEAAESWNFAEGRDERSDVAGRGVAANPCWFESETAHLQFDPAASLPQNAGAPAVIYPIDRTQATPLNLFLLVDVMRSTLGMGPCQYILDLEGLDAQSTPTPALVTEWIEAQVKRKRGKQSLKNANDRLQAMVDHVEHAEHRIASYGDFASSIDSDAEGVQRIVADMKSTIGDLAPARKTPEEAKALAAEISAAVENDAGLEAIEHPAEVLRAIGAAQDRTLAKCRMGVRRLEQYCLMASAEGASPDLAAILKRARDMLAETT